jgi:hypothetical protein
MCKRIKMPKVHGINLKTNISSKNSVLKVTANLLAQLNRTLDNGPLSFTLVHFNPSQNFNVSSAKLQTIVLH